jgi:hypothetical protein
MHKIGEGDLMEGSHLENPGDTKIRYIKVVNIKGNVVLVCKRVTGADVTRMHLDLK